MSAVFPPVPVPGACPSVLSPVPVPAGAARAAVPSARIPVPPRALRWQTLAGCPWAAPGRDASRRDNGPAPLFACRGSGPGFGGFVPHAWWGSGEEGLTNGLVLPGPWTRDGHTAWFLVEIAFGCVIKT